MVPEASESEGHEPRDGLLFSGIIALRSAMPIICRGACASQQQGGCSAGAKYGRRARVHAKVRAAAGGGGGGGGGGASSMICRCAQSKRSAAVAFLADVGPSAPAYAMQAPIIPDCAGRVLTVLPACSQAGGRRAIAMSCREGHLSACELRDGWRAFVVGGMGRRGQLWTWPMARQRRVGVKIRAARGGQMVAGRGRRAANRRGGCVIQQGRGLKRQH